MSIFTGRITHLGGTKIFARLDMNEAGEVAQYLVYSMSVGTDSETAMIIPLPVSSQSEDALDFIPLNGYTEFFDHMEKGFPSPLAGLDKGIASIASDPGSPRNKLAVQAVGDFIASFVPTLGDFDRLDTRFHLPASTWDKLSQYRDWGYAVFQLKESAVGKASAKGFARRIHPMAFQFPTDMDESLYFPTLLVHDGQVNDTREFDHTLYFQGEEYHDFADEITPNNADAFMKIEKAGGIVHPDTVCGRRSIVGMFANEDTCVSRPE